MQSCDTGQWIPFFDRCQLITTWMSKFNTDIIKVWYFASANMKGWTYAQTYSVRTIYSEPKFLGSKITIFSYPWCSAVGALRTRAPQLFILSTYLSFFLSQQKKLLKLQNLQSGNRGYVKGDSRSTASFTGN